MFGALSLRLGLPSRFIERADLKVAIGVDAPPARAAQKHAAAADRHALHAGRDRKLAVVGGGRQLASAERIAVCVARVVGVGLPLADPEVGAVEGRKRRRGELVLGLDGQAVAVRGPGEARLRDPRHGPATGDPEIAIGHRQAADVPLLGQLEDALLLPARPVDRRLLSFLLAS
jgi:hypothetical protein